MARQTDIVSFRGLARTLITICNNSSMGKSFRVEKKNTPRFINKSLASTQFLTREWGLYGKVLQLYLMAKLQRDGATPCDHFPPSTFQPTPKQGRFETLSALAVDLNWLWDRKRFLISPSVFSGFPAGSEEH